MLADGRIAAAGALRRGARRHGVSSLEELFVAVSPRRPILKSLEMSIAALVVFKKELKEGLRDRRSILAALAATLAGPLIVGVILTIVAGIGSRAAHGLTCAGAERAPGLMQSLRAERIVILSAPPALEADVRAGRIDVGLVIPDDYPAKLDSVRPAAVSSCRIPRAAPRATLPDACGRWRATRARCRTFA